MTKPKRLSKTLWFNGLTLAALALGALAAEAGALDLPPWAPVALAVAQAVVNGGLRLLTAEPLRGTPADPSAR